MPDHPAIELNARQQATLEAIFAQPTLANVEWVAIESLLKAIGCTVKEGKGSGVKFRKADLTLFVHRPHPSKEAKRYQVENAREFLSKLGVTPNG